MARLAMCGRTAECWTRETAMGGHPISRWPPPLGMLVVKAQLEGCTQQVLVDMGCSVMMVSAAAVLYLFFIFCLKIVYF